VIACVDVIVQSGCDAVKEILESKPKPIPGLEGLDYNFGNYTRHGHNHSPRNDHHHQHELPPLNVPASPLRTGIMGSRMSVCTSMLM
jgi:hypothetical protein